jgi:ribosome-binding factor A
MRRVDEAIRHARVYVSVLGDDEQRQATMAGLRSAHGFLQGKVASELHLKRTPTLELHYDDTTDRALRVDELIEEIGGGQG